MTIDEEVNQLCKQIEAKQFFADYQESHGWVAQQLAPCDSGHVDAEITATSDGVYRMHCKECGFMAWANRTSAEALGWIEGTGA